MRPFVPAAPMPAVLATRTAAALAAVLTATSGSQADVTIGDFSVAEHAFADSLLSATPSPGDAFRHESLDPGGSGVLHVDLTLPQDFAVLQSLLVGPDLNDWVGVRQAAATLALGFSPPHPVDGPGPDLVLFDIGNRESIAVTIGDLTRAYALEDTGDDITSGQNSRDVNFAAIDLADFGVATTSSVVLRAVSGGDFDADPAALGALHTGGTTAVGNAAERRSPGPVLEQNAPNPFRASTEIGFTLARDGDVELTVHAVSGRLVRVIARIPMAAGRHSLSWDGLDASGRPVPAGVYFYRIAADGRSEARKLIRRP